jgi:ABC-type sugar transport system ATPase subunit
MSCDWHVEAFAGTTRRMHSLTSGVNNKGQIVLLLEPTAGLDSWEWQGLFSFPREYSLLAT